MQQVATIGTTAAVERPRPQAPVNEDWLAVGIGAAVIGLILLGVRPEIPRFGWNAPSDLSGTVLTADNLARAVQVGILLLIPAAAGARLMGARLVPFVIGFTVLYGLACVSQVLAGYAGSSGL